MIKEVLNICKNKETIFIYVSKEDEVDTHDLIKELLKKKKRVIVPKCNTQGCKIIPCKINSFCELKPGHYNILEPKENKIISKEEIDIFLIPGTAFDKKGNRKGRGDGYFDRFLADISRDKIIGLCYTDQLKEKIKTNKWDVPMNKVISIPRDNP
jgi:5-formyltetrahydrofolate cyclo-ligase